MYSLVCLALLAITWPSFLHLEPVKIIALSGGVYTLLQLFKRLWPAICGKYAVAFNVAFSFAGILASTPADQLWQTNFWANVMIAVASAAGIHGTVSKLADDEAKKLSPAVPALLLALVLCGGTTGCMKHVDTPVTATQVAPGAVDALDSKANQDIRAARAFAAHVSADIKSGKLGAGLEFRQLMNHFNQAIMNADAARVAYHSGGGGTAGALQAALTAMQSDWDAAQATVTAQLAK